MSDDLRDDPDVELLARVARHDAAAARQIVALKLPRLFSLALRMLGDRDDANDVVQDVFIRVWQQAPHWEPGVARFDTWLHRVTLNACYDRLRARGRWRQVDIDDDTGHDDYDGRAGHAASVTLTDPQLLPEDALDAASYEVQMSQRVQAALEGLPVRQREALVLQYYQALSNIDAAAVMGISVEALESLLSRARRTLRQRLNGAWQALDAQARR